MQQQTREARVFCVTKQPSEASATGESRVTQAVWIMTPCQATASLVEQTLNGQGRFKVGGVCRGLTELSRSLEQEPAPVALVDVDEDSSRVLGIMEIMVCRFPRTRFVVISSGDAGLADEAMGVGARQFLLKHALSDELPSVLQRLTGGSNGSEPDPIGRPSGTDGQVVTLLSAGGGCGATTLGINLAAALNGEASSPSLLVEMDAAYGATTTYLDVHGEFGTADVLRRYGGVDSALIRATAKAHSPLLHVLLGPASINAVEPLEMNFEQLSDLVEATRRAYGRVVVDAPRVPIQASTQLAAMSLMTLVVLQPTYKDLRMARGIRLAMCAAGVPAGGIRFVLNRYCRHGDITAAEASHGLDGEKVWVVREDEKPVRRSAELGQTIWQTAPRSKYAAEVRSIAATINELIPAY